MVHEINEAEAKKNKDFVNFHSTNRKRRLDEISDSSTHNLANIHVRPLANRTANFSSNSNQIGTGSVIGNAFSNILRPNINRLSPVSNDLSLEEDLDKILNDVNTLTSREEIKDYLKKTINKIASKF